MTKEIDKKRVEKTQPKVMDRPIPEKINEGKKIGRPTPVKK